MKVRESGMPDEAMWSGFFRPEEVLAKLGLIKGCGDVVDLGCGYGTFTIPAARMAMGMVHAFDIEREMVRLTARKATEANLENVRAVERDFVCDGTGMADGSVDFVMLFNILHCERPEVLLREAWRVLARGGRAGIIHWNYDVKTPRGPSMGIRPRPEQCRVWAQEEGFHVRVEELIDLPPYHYGWSLEKLTKMGAL